MDTPTKNPHHTDEDFLDVDQPLPGQQYVCLSFVSPEKTLLNKEQWQFYHYHQYVISEYNKIFNELTDKMLESGEDQVDTVSVVDLKKRMKRIFEANEIKYDKWNELVDDFKFREGDKVNKLFDQANGFQTSVRGVKVRGVYDTYREAEVRSKVLQRMDNRFDVFIGQVGYWLPWHPDVNKIAAQEYLNDDLNTLMKEYKENEVKRDMFYQDQTRQRTQEAKEQSDRMRKQLEADHAQVADSNKVVNAEVVSSVTDSMSKLTDVDPWMQRKLGGDN